MRFGFDGPNKYCTYEMSYEDSGEVDAVESQLGNWWAVWLAAGKENPFMDGTGLATETTAEHRPFCWHAGLFLCPHFSLPALRLASSSSNFHELVCCFVCAG